MAILAIYLSHFKSDVDGVKSRVNTILPGYNCILLPYLNPFKFNFDGEKSKVGVPN